MKYATVCSGINAPAVAWNSMGWQEQFCAEIESFPCSALKQRHPEAPNLGDITKYADWPDFGIELLAGGTPCQSFSLAGLRKGMDDPRGQLTRSFVGIAAKYRPRWICWENVPGVFSADNGEAFAGFLAGLTGRKIAVPAEGWGSFGILPGIPEAYGIAWRVLDTQFVRVDTHPRACPQRRERVFVVGHIGGCWQRAAAVLLERESLCGNPAPRRKTGQGAPSGIAPSLTGSGRGVARHGDSRGQDPVVAVSTTIGCRGNRSHSELDGHGAHVVSHALTGVESDASEDGTGRGTPLVACPLTTKPHADNESQHDKLIVMPNVAATLMSGANTKAAHCARTRHSKDATLICMAHGQANAEISRDGSPSLTCIHEAPIVAYHPQSVMTLAIRGRGNERNLECREDGTSNAVLTPTVGRDGMGVGTVATFQQSSQAGKGTIGYDESGIAKPCKTQPDGQMLHAGTAVRRLTPEGCGFLQGFPRGYLDVIHNGKPAKGGPKYRALGNAMSCNVMRWIGQRIDMVDAIP